MKQFVLALLLALAAPVVDAAPVRYDLLQQESQVGFSWFLGREEVKGRMPVKRADVVLDFSRIENSRVNVAVDVTRAVAGFPFASQGMKSRKVLWADKFPEITFQSTRVRRDGDGAKVEGDLTVRGVTRPVVFDAQLFRPSGAAAGDREKLSIRLNGSLSRKAFGADGWADLAGDEVRLQIVTRIQIAE